MGTSNLWQNRVVAWQVLVRTEARTVIPTALLFSRYRAFREFTRLDLAPLTVIIGKNGGGKSVLARLPLLLASGLSSQAEAPLDLYAGGVRHASRFEDIIYQRSAQPFSLGGEISAGDRTLQFVTTLRHVVESRSLGIEAFELSDSGQRILSLKAARPEDIGNRDATFLAQLGPDSGECEVRVTMVGLFPTAVHGREDVSAQVVERRRLFERAFAPPSYLGPFREPESLPQVARQGIRDLGPGGERALDLLGDDAIRGDGALVRSVEDWFEDAMGGNRVKLQMVGDLPRLWVHDPIRNMDVDIRDTGTGFAQVFPVAVQALARRMGRITNSIVIVEQPELHLHPGAHGDVADLIGDTVLACGEGVRYICETHSEQVVTRLRRRIAEGTFPNGAIKLVSVGHQSAVEDPIEPLRSIALDDLGNPDAWPVGVFNEAFDDLVLLREAAEQRLAKGSRLRS